jgi:hypothetical protein
MYYPLTEEAAKGLAVGLLFWLMRAECDNARDGLIYGAHIGLGFLAAETLLLIVRGYLLDGSTTALNLLLTNFVFLDLNGHTLWSALFGASIGLAVQTRRRWLTIAAPVAGFILALMGNNLYRFGSVSVMASMLSALGLTWALLGEFGRLPWQPVWGVAALSTLVTQAPFYLAAAAVLMFSSTWERSLYRTYLAAEVGSVALTTDEYAALVAGQRLPCDRRARQIRICQAELAMRKWHVAHMSADPEADPIVSAWRDDIATLRHATAGPVSLFEQLRSMLHLVRRNARADDSGAETAEREQRQDRRNQ